MYNDISFYFRRGSLPPAALPTRVDLILAADCVYFEPAFPLLVKTLTDLVAGNDPEILFCYKKRRKVSNKRLRLPSFHAYFLSWIFEAGDHLLRILPVVACRGLYLATC